MRRDIQDFGISNNKPSKYQNQGNGFRNNSQNQDFDNGNFFEGLKNQYFILDKQLLKTHQRKQTLFKFGKYQVYFPYENMHDAQKKYMNQIFNTLDGSDNLLIQSPTGTGKTLCLLLSTMAWVQKRYEQTKQKIKIIYTSRSHSQLQQIEKQLKKTSYRPNMVIYGSRQKLCINTPILQKDKKIQDMSYENWSSHCNKAVRQKMYYIKEMKEQKKMNLYDTKIQYIHQTSQDKTYQRYREKIQLEFDPKNQDEINYKKKKLNEIFSSTQKRCSYFHEYDYYERQGPIFKSLKHQILTLSKMKQQGEKQHFCPFYYPRRVKNLGTLFLMPYNYLLDETILQYSQSLIQDSIIIFDQGHNIIKTACQGSSFRFDRHTINEAFYNSQISQQGEEKVDADQFQKKSQQKRQNDKNITKVNNSKDQKFDYHNDEILRNILLNMRQNFDSFFNQSEMLQFETNLLDKSEKLYHSANPKKIQQILMEIFFRQKLDMYKQLISLKQIFQLIVLYINDIIQKRKKAQKYYFKLEKISKNIQKILKILTNQYYQEKYFLLLKKVYLKKGSSIEIKGECYFQCLTPQYIFKQITNLKPRSIVITSGTLSPMEIWQKQLKIPLIQFSNSHVINETNVLAKVIPKFITTLKMNDLEFQQNLIDQALDVIQKILQKTPNGVLIIVPSFSYMKKVKQVFQSQSKQKYLNRKKKFFLYKKTILFEGKKDFVETMKQYSQAAVQKSGALLFCVCRGKMSEGIDFTDKLCRAVIFIGIPYAYLKDPFIQQKQIFLKRFPISYSKIQKNDQKKKKYKTMTGKEWYKFQAARAVNQSLGRVVRHQFDYGIIYLLDSRFAGGSNFDYDMQVRNNISNWISKYLREDQSLENILIQVTKFYEQKQKKETKVLNVSTLQIQNQIE